jgi:hypothetical protein
MLNIENEIIAAIKYAVFRSVEDRAWSDIWRLCTFDAAESAHSRILHPTWNLMGASKRGLRHAILEIFEKK